MARAWRPFTLRGWTLLALGPCVAGAGSVLSEIEFVQLGLAITLVPLVGLAWVLVSSSTPRIVRDVEPRRAVLGQRVQHRLTITARSTSRLALHRFEDVVPSVMGPRPRTSTSLLAGKHRTTSTLTPESRGRHRIGPLLMRRSDPFGTVALDSVISGTTDVVVTPPVIALEEHPEVITTGVIGDGEVQHNASSGQDDAQVRPYQEGDERRRVHWRSTAHRGELMVRQQQPPREIREVLWMDDRASQHRGRGRHSSFEHAVVALTSFAAHACDTHTPSVHIGELALNSGAGSRRLALEQVLDALAVAEPTTGTAVRLPSVTTTPERRTLIAIAGKIDYELADALVAWGRSDDDRILLALDVDAFAGHPADHSGRSRSETVTQVRRLDDAGWHVVHATPHDTLPQVWGQMLDARNR